MKSNSRSISRSSGGLTPISNEEVLDEFQDKEKRARKETEEIVQQVLKNRPKWSQAAKKVDPKAEQILRKSEDIGNSSIILTYLLAKSEMTVEELAAVIKGMTTIMNNDKVIREKDTVSRIF
jgi:flagellar motor switch/type III secretory pathway protein FliN